jgi:hypothetical protein
VRLILSVSAVLLLAVAVAVLCRWAGLKAWHALVCVLFGFYLAASSFAPAIARLAAAVARAVAGR